MESLIHLSQIGSTNNYLRELLTKDPELPAYTIVDTHTQTSGRGQRGNSWESEPGQNISCSILLRPELPESVTTFDLNRVTSLALFTLLSRYIEPSQIRVKWPNDLLIGQRKIAGILTENEWLGDRLNYTIVGIGLNVKQTQFGAYHPSATSLALEGIALPQGYEAWHHPMVQEIALLLQEEMERLTYDVKALREEYHQYLYGYQQERAYQLPSGERLLGTILQVLPNGLLEIESTSRGKELFAFKEISTLL